MPSNDSALISISLYSYLQHMEIEFQAAVVHNHWSVNTQTQNCGTAKKTSHEHCLDIGLADSKI